MSHTHETKKPTQEMRLVFATVEDRFSQDWVKNSQSMVSNQMQNWYVPSYLTKRDGDSVEHLINWGAYELMSALIVGLRKVTELNHILQRCEWYLTDNGEIDRKLQCKEGEGSFMTAVLNGDVVEAMARGNGDYRAIICDAIKDGKIVDFMYSTGTITKS